MRTIKFRAWDTRIGKWYESVNPPIQWMDGHTRPQSPFYTQTMVPEGVVLMQFTGLHDKNGKEIYEGDVVVIPNHYPFFDYPEGVEGDLNKPLVGKVIPNYRGVVEWIYSQWQVVLNCVNPNKRGISDGINEGLNDEGVEDGEKSKWEVIGNIYENPDLLK